MKTLDRFIEYIQNKLFNHSVFNKQFYFKNWKTLVRIFQLAVVFGTFKVLAFLSPLGMSSIIDSVTVYGEFEYTINLGLILSSLVSAGLVGAYGFFILRSKLNDLKAIFHFHFLILTSVLIVTTLIFPELLSNNYFGGIILGVAFADQILVAAILKGSNKNILAVIVDTGVYIVMTILFFLVYFEIVQFTQGTWHLSILILIFLTAIIYHFPRISNLKRLQFKDVILVYRFGGLILITGPLLVLVASSTRLFIEHFVNLSDVAKYSIIFRISGLSLIIFRLAGIILFRSLYQSDHKVLDQRFSLLFTVLLIFNFGSFIILPRILDLYYLSFSNVLLGNWKLFLLCQFQVTFWMNISLFESAFHRENQLKKFILLLIVSCGILVGLFFTLDLFDLLTLNTIVVLNSLIIFLVFYGQQFILKRINIEYPKTRKIHTLTGVLFGISVFLIYFL